MKGAENFVFCACINITELFIIYWIYKEAGDMNDTQKRRIKLLEETRERYSDRYTPPAVHPRYRNPYRKLYDSETYATPGTFGIRFVLSVLLFAAFVTMDIKDQKVFQIGSDRIVQEIGRKIDIVEVWKNL